MKSGLFPRWGSFLKNIRGNVVVIVSNDGTININQSYGGSSLAFPPTVPFAAALPRAESPFETFDLLSWKSRLSQDVVGREEETLALTKWATTGPRLRMRFLVGPGGAGKTRLAAEVAWRLCEQGWLAGFAALDRETTLPLSERGLFLLVDYPEAWND
jgi:hypothetical protein